MDTLGVIAGHMAIAEIKGAVGQALPGTQVDARQLTGPDVWIVEAVSEDGCAIAVTAYLNSYSAGDYTELGLNESTLVLVEHGPHSEALVRKVIGPRLGWIKPHDRSKWQAIRSE